MAIRGRMTGNQAVSHAIKQINPDVMPAFPITPSTEIPEMVAEYISNGEMDTEFIAVESEHSAMSAAIGSQSAGSRSVTATSSAGLAYMWETLYLAASKRLPITMPVVNRALSGPININADHADSMGARDSGWIQIYSENNQEAYDNYIMSVRIAEHPDVQLPVMTCMDGFITSHALENIQTLKTGDVKKFVGGYEPKFSLLDKDTSLSVGPYDTQHYYMEHKRQQAEAMMKAKEVILEISKEYEELSGRSYGLFEEYKLDDAEIALVIINSAAGTSKVVIDKLRDQGIKAGLLKIRVFRPFPAEEIREALKHVKALAVMDRSEGFSGHGGPVYPEITSALYGLENGPLAINYIYGIGGRDVTTDSIQSVFEELLEIQKSGETGDKYRYLSLRD